MQDSGETSGTYNGMSSDNIKGLVLALSSSFFIGASFIVKKKGLKKAGTTGLRAGFNQNFPLILNFEFFFSDVVSSWVFNL